MDFKQLLKNDFIILDGAMGTMLQAAGLEAGGIPELLNITDPELIHEKYNHLVDLVIDGGYGNNIPSTVIDCTGDEIIVTRQGLGEL